MDDPYNLQRFVDAQRAVFDDVRAELRDGRKRGHWMWFIFPQIAGLGSSAMAQWFAISSRQEAAAYLQHPVLAPRLIECTQLVTRVQNRTIEEIFGDIDALKFRSSMTLFAQAAPDEVLFRAALDKYFGSQLDPLTLERL
ncbi:MAG: DUF1810 domain-containing protein [Rhodocyclaceae bacterium]|nr:DUF1810 domain-containing protein [Rhodocyclaceae bacterium]